ncbi:ABC transporter%2C ATP-binding protein/permease%2C glycan transport [Campylobacter hyointestinalis subsp. hyointestinalis]|uniref:ABC transporter ATP-binding protein/permease n=2 Tax=Campylobacter hyointestinalis TaxID=198 RepID=UPI0007292529|nr:ABC transporter ATP-binding protein [Campylobacter hyointestinalis]CUU67902.1 ABC transporter%2C ATP-binding protein/permease%2C glycan transport [Campylobacter hyointestinalis subsp. hyointestinalis]
MSNLKKIRCILSRHDKIYLLILLFMSIFLSFIETVGISAIMPFITVATNPAQITQNIYFKDIYDFFAFDKEMSFVIAFGFLLIVFYIFRALYNIFYVHVLNKFAFGRYHIFAYRLFDTYVHLPYQNFVKQNSSQLTKAIINEASNLSFYIQNLLSVLSEVFTIILLYSILLVVDWKMTLVLTLVLGIKILLITKILSKKIKAQGEKRSQSQGEFYKILSETFGNFKIVKFIQNETKILHEFSTASTQYAKSNIVNATLQQLPRSILETVGFGSLIAIVIFILLRYEDASKVLPIISMYALALYRMLPAINKILSSYNGMLFISKALDIVYEELQYSSPKEGDQNINFKSEIVLNNISFEYIASKPVLKNISLSIKKGEKIAFIGESGSGKSTLVDLIIGLYRPNKGEIYVDGILLDDENIRSWRSKIGYIPQSIYLFDGTVKENVAFGYELDESKVVECLKKANIYDFLSQKDGIDTRVGEGGIQLSGGQKQRIGIARALYNDPEILVLDEATSALDNDTEAKIMDEIYEVSNDKTLIIIAHRLSTIERCERKIRLDRKGTC